MSITITASMLYDFVKCPTRPAMDLFEDPTARDPVSKFVQLLWERGTAFEDEVIQSLHQPYTDLKGLPVDERERETRKAIDRGDKIIYGARLRHGDLLGEPDLLRWQEGRYIAGDIKSGAGEEGGSDLADGKLKEHYAIQLALYTDILEHQNISAGRVPFVWDIHRREVTYDLNAPRGLRTLDSFWDVYNTSLNQVRDIVLRKESALPALSSECKLCHWRSVCNQRLEKLGDLTLIPDLGRSKRNAMLSSIPTVAALASMDWGAPLRQDSFSPSLRWIPNPSPTTLPYTAAVTSVGRSPKRVTADLSPSSHLPSTLLYTSRGVR